MNLGKYNKLWLALIGALVAFLIQFYGADNSIVTLVVGLLTALGVYAAPNTEVQQ